jgi:hypothetical protein
MIRTLAIMLALSPPALAQTGPTPHEFAKARADCATRVQPECLLVLATEIALADPATSEGALNVIASARISMNDFEGADRILKLTTPGFIVLSQLGRHEEAGKVLRETAEGLGLTMGEAETVPGEAEKAEVKRLLKAGLADDALQAALSIDDGLGSTKAETLRLIVDHHIAEANFASAASVAFQIDVDQNGALADAFAGLYGGFHAPRQSALAAVVEAQAGSGDLSGATALTDSLIEPRGQVVARLALARAAFGAGEVDLAKAQLDLVLSGVRALEPDQFFGTMILTQSADLALVNGEIQIARLQAEAAYRVGARPTVRRGGQNAPPAPSKIDLLRLATVLQLVGLTEKGKALYARASVPEDTDSVFNLGMIHLATLLVSQVRLGDLTGAAETQAQLFGMDGMIWQDGRPALHLAAQSLIDYGFLQEALAIADQLEAKLRGDLFALHGGNPAPLYEAILTKDPTLAPTVLKDSLGARAHFRASLALARSLAAKGEADAAKAVLVSLFGDHQRRAAAEEKFNYNPTCAFSFIALTQDELGFDAEAEATRQQALDFIRTQMPADRQPFGLAVLAGGFPQQAATTLTFDLSCIEYDT